ncbi:hypothetical protein [Nonomuraea sp. NPDC049607]|uniref:nSTAND1 domain-containing NTPase n=1 Tax=Nonomuraea sp. NPDC049607 TaxID=3154732 RepID=UPI003432EB9E
MADPARINSRADLHAALRQLFEEFEGSYLHVATAAGIGVATVHDMVRGKSFPRWANLRKVLGAVGIAVADLGAWKQAHARAERADDGCPYRGLEVFEPEHVKYFCGRRDLTRLLWDRVSAQIGRDGPLLVTGPSGAGKSSLLRAGLIPSAGKEWPEGHVILTPGGTSVHSQADDPVRVLADKFCGQDDPDDVRDRLAGKPALLHDLLTRARCRLLIVDQFEELFSTCANADDRRIFVQALHAACSPARGAPAAVVVIGMRADFFGHCAAHPELAPALARPLVVGPMTTTQLREAIEKPAERAELTLETGLAERIVEDLGAASTDDTVLPAISSDPGGVLPLLSHTLRATWGHREGRKLTLAGYQATGGVSKSLARTADTALDTVGLAHRDRARSMLTRLVHLGEGSEPSRRKVALTELLGPEDSAGYEAARQVLDRFVEHRLVTVNWTVDSERADSTAEFTHEALIRAWKQLRDWIEEHRDSLLVREQLDRDARAWAGKGRDAAYLYRGLRLASAQEASKDDGDRLGNDARDFLDAGTRQDQAERDSVRRRARNRTMLSAVLALLLMIAIGAAGTVIVQNRTVSKQRDEAVGARAANLAAAMAPTDPIIAKQLGVAAATLAPEAFETRSTLLTLYNQAELYTYRPPGVDGSWRTDGDDTGRLRVYARGNEVKVADVDARRVIRSFTFPGRPLDTRLFAGPGLSGDGKVLALLRQDRTIALFDTATGRPRPVTFRAPTVFFGLDTTGEHLLLSESDASGLWDTSSGERLVEIPYLLGSADITPDGKHLVTPHETSLDFWDLRTGRKARTLRLVTGKERISKITLSPDGKLLALTQGNRLGVVPFTQLGPSQVKWRTIRKTGGTNEGIIFSSDSRYVSFNGVIWDTKDLFTWGSNDDQPIYMYANANCFHYAFGPGDRTLRCLEDSGGGTTTVVSLAAILDPVTFHPDPSGLAVSDMLMLGDNLVLSDDGSTLALVNDAGEQVEIWDPIKVVRRNTLHVSGTDYQLSEDGRLLAVSNGNREIQIWDVASATKKTTLTGLPPLGESRFAFSPDGKTLAVLTKASRDASLLELWDIVSGTRRAAVTGQFPAGTYGPFSIQMVYPILFSRDGRMVISAPDQGVVETSTGKRLVPPNSGVSVPMALSADGILADNHYNGKLTLWDSRSLQQVGTPSVGGSPAAFSPDGRLLAVADATDQIQLWDVTAGQPLGLPLSGFFHPEDPLGDSSLNSLAFAPDGSAVLTIDRARLRTHLIAPDKIKAALCAQSGPLSEADWKTFIPEIPYRRTC